MAGRFSQRGLAREAGLGIDTVRDLLAGRSDPSLSTLLALADALDLRSIDELLGPLPTESILEARRRGSPVDPP